MFSKQEGKKRLTPPEKEERIPMKKLLSMILVLAMCLMATGALADIVICQNKVEITSQMQAFAKVYQELDSQELT